jgi:hypothetical protein
MRRPEAAPVGYTNGTKRHDADAAPAKERATCQLPVELTERVRDAVYWTPGATLAGFFEEALKRHLEHLEKKRGEPFPHRSGQLKTGRPIKSR